ncbi:MAG: RcgR family putative quorum lactone hydrolase [Bryobacteraceae bacterium]
MFGLYGRWIDRWETKLATRDTNRVVREFDWGLDWLSSCGWNGDPARELREYVRCAVERSDEFYSYKTPERFQLGGNRLTFQSAVASPFPENDTVHAAFFPAPGGSRRAVLVLPQWNADAGSHLGLCKLLNHFGLTALRMSMAYHDYRMPPELERADYHMSSNIGRTIHAMRQSVVDARSCLDWLEQQGYRDLAILGTSLGSCVAFITAAHEKRLKAGVFNHVSMNVSDVVWTGLSTRHIKAALEKRVSADELREYWSVISPSAYLARMAGRDLRSLLVWARYDTTFLPVFSRQVLDTFRGLGLQHEVFALPCAHYTTGKFPFNLLDGLVMCRFLHRNL